MIFLHKNHMHGINSMTSKHGVYNDYSIMTTYLEKLLNIIPDDWVMSAFYLDERVLVLHAGLLFVLDNVLLIPHHSVSDNHP